MLFFALSCSSANKKFQKDTDSSASTEFNVSDVETTMVQVNQPMDMEEEDAIDDAVLVPLRNLMDIDTTVVPQQVPSAYPQ